MSSAARADGAVVGAEAVDCLAAQVAGEEGLLEGVEVTGDVVLAVELVLGEDAQEDVFGEYVLQQHLPDVRLRNVGADGALAEVEEGGRRALVVGALALGVLNRLAEAREDCGEVGLELAPAPCRNSSISGSS